MTDKGPSQEAMVGASAEGADRPVGKDACLVVIYGDNLGMIFDLNTPLVLIGRSSKCDIRIDQESISRNHSKIVNTGKSILIRDLGTTNGTYVNDEPIDEYVLRDGDLIKMGRTIFKFLTRGNIERHYHEQMSRLAALNRQPIEPDRSASDSSTTMILPRSDSGNGEGGPKKRA